MSADIEKYGDDDSGQSAEWREEIESIERGDYTPYGVTVAKVCECCGHVTEEYVAALWGCVVEAHGLEGRYTSPEDVPDDYLRSVAQEVLAEAQGL